MGEKTRMSNINETLLNAVKFDEKGLVCAIAQDWQTRRVLMVAWMNAEALQKTVETGFAIKLFLQSLERGGMADSRCRVERRRGDLRT